MKKRITLLALVGLLALACVQSACSNADIKQGARVASASAQGGIDEFASEVNAGELDPVDAQIVNNILAEVRDASDKIANDPRDFSKLTPAEKRQLVEDYISYLNERAERLNQEGVLHIKNDKSRAKFNSVTREIERALSIARVVEAALPPPATASQ